MYDENIENCSDLQEDEDRTFQKTMQILEDIGIERVSVADCINVAYVCSLVSSRFLLTNVLWNFSAFFVEYIRWKENARKLMEEK